MKMINLGDEVEDTVTGFRGIAVAKHIFLHGISTVSVQPLLDCYGILPEHEIFAEAQLKVLKNYIKKEPTKLEIAKETI